MAASDLQLVSVGAGALALSHRPGRNDIPLLPSHGITHVVTLLSDREGAADIGRAVEQAGMIWRWVPLRNGQPPDAERTTTLRPILADLATLLQSGASLLVHCSAGIHRTGMFGYAILRQCGLSATDARARLAQLRAVTSDGVGAHRLAWGDSLFGA